MSRSEPTNTPIINYESIPFTHGVCCTAIYLSVYVIVFTEHGC
jgi:hypothetical protein